MGAAIPLRDDFDGAQLRGLAKVSKDADQARRLIALAVIYDGGSRLDAARIGDVGLQIVRDWVLRFNAEGPRGLVNRKAPGRSCKLTPEQREMLAKRVEDGPDPAVHGVVRWRLKDLADWISSEFDISLAETTVSRELKKLGFTKLTARPRHVGQDGQAIEDFKKTSPQS